MTTTAKRTGTDTRTFRAGDLIAWTNWAGQETIAAVTRCDEFRYSRVFADGLSESIDHAWDRTTYRVVGHAATPGKVLDLPVAEVEPSFLDGRRTFTTHPDRTDAIQVAMFDAASVNAPALF